MENFCKFQEESIDRKDIKPGMFIKVEGDKFTRVESTSSYKPGRHGLAKTLLRCKDIGTKIKRDVVFNTSDKAIVVRMVRFSTILTGFDGSTLTLLACSGEFVPLNVDRIMSDDDKDKIQRIIEHNDDVEAFDLVFKALPGYIKLEFIKPMRKE